MVSIEILKILKYHTFSKKKIVLSIFCSTCKNEDAKIFKEENQHKDTKNYWFN